MIGGDSDNISNTSIVSVAITSSSYESGGGRTTSGSRGLLSPVVALWWNRDVRPPSKTVTQTELLRTMAAAVAARRQPPQVATYYDFLILYTLSYAE